MRDTRVGPMLIVHLIIDVRDAMGANSVNTSCETVAPLIAQLDQPQDWKRLAGPICCCGRPPLWVYTDGRQIHVARWLAPWTQRQLLRSGRRKRDATLRTD